MAGKLARPPRNVDAWRERALCGPWRLVNANAVSLGILRFIKSRVRGAEKCRESQHVVRFVALGDADAQRRLALEMGNGIGEIDSSKGLTKLLNNLVRLRERCLRK